MPSGDGWRARHQLIAVSMSVMWMPAMAKGRADASRAVLIGESHDVADVLHRLARDGTRALGAHLDDPVHLLRIGQVLLGTLAPRLLLAQDGVDHGLLAVQAADA